MLTSFARWVQLQPCCLRTMGFSLCNPKTSAPWASSDVMPALRKTASTLAKTSEAHLLPGAWIPRLIVNFQCLL